MTAKKEAEAAAAEPAGPDKEAEEQDLARAEAQVNPTGVAPTPPAPPAKGDDYPEDEAAPGLHDGPPKRINCPNCGHSHQTSFTNCARCGAKLPRERD